MTSTRITAVTLLTGAALLVAGGGTALAQQGTGDRAAKCQERLAKLAEKRGTTVAELEAGAKARMTARIDRALAAGRITTEQAATLKQRVAQAQACAAPAALKAKVLKAKLAQGGMLRAAVKYLGLTPTELRKQLPGSSLAAIATAQGKSVDGLEAAMLAPAKARLAKAVASDRITQARADQALERLEALVERLVTFTFPSA